MFELLEGTRNGDDLRRWEEFPKDLQQGNAYPYKAAETKRQTDAVCTVNRLLFAPNAKRRGFLKFVLNDTHRCRRRKQK